MIKRSFDEKAIREILDHPDIKPFISDNDAPYDVPLTGDYHYLLGDGCLFILHPYNETTHECHVNILKRSRHKSVELATEAMEYAKTLSNHFVTPIPDRFPNVQAFALKMGLTETDTPNLYEKRFS